MSEELKSTNGSNSAISRLPLKEAMANGDFAVTCEIGPPKGVDTAEIYEVGEILKGLVNGINVTDLQSSVMRLGSLAACHMLKDMGHDPIFQMTCRDRNRLALQSDLLSAYALGIRNVLSLTGDHTTTGDHPQAKPVYDLDSVSLLYTMSKLEEGLDLVDNPLKGKPSFFKGAVVNPGADTDASLNLQLMKMQKKIDAGAQFFQTQAVFDERVMEKFAIKIEKLGIKVPVMAGVILLKSEKMANYMNKNVPGIFVPKNIIDRMAATTDKVSMCLEILTELITRLKPYCAGVHIQALGWEKHVPALIENVGI
ncbi:MAG: Bifunctional homocysteine S-methyltransferase/5,10-methylenetetrahydrofolate reductase [Actinobacteria bacterium ADurb.Bin346]|nr:MAG: Bifunctional homocysteine S-methyltransferase/5,10-methylenetetrahydrofolate reductase [Actinobacteria bacterium ADurb.Bin346]